MEIIRHIKTYGECTTSKVGELLEVKDRRARTLLVNLVKKKILQKSGNASKTIYLSGEAFLKLAEE